MIPRGKRGLLQQNCHTVSTFAAGAPALMSLGKTPDVTLAQIPRVLQAQLLGKFLQMWFAHRSPE